MEKNDSSYETIKITENNYIDYGYSENSISIVCPSPKGKEIALKLQKHLNAELYIKESYRDLNESDKGLKESYNGLNESKKNNENIEVEVIDGIIIWRKP